MMIPKEIDLELTLNGFLLDDSAEQHFLLDDTHAYAYRFRDINQHPAEQVCFLWCDDVLYLVSSRTSNNLLNLYPELPRLHFVFCGYRVVNDNGRSIRVPMFERVK